MAEARSTLTYLKLDQLVGAAAMMCGQPTWPAQWLSWSRWPTHSILSNSTLGRIELPGGAPGFANSRWEEAASCSPGGDHFSAKMQMLPQRPRAFPSADVEESSPPSDIMEERIRTPPSGKKKRLRRQGICGGPAWGCRLLRWRIVSSQRFTSLTKRLCVSAEDDRATPNGGGKNRGGKCVPGRERDVARTGGST